MEVQQMIASSTLLAAYTLVHITTSMEDYCILWNFKRNNAYKIYSGWCAENLPLLKTAVAKIYLHID